MLVQQHRQTNRKAYTVLKSDPEHAHADALEFLRNDPLGADAVLFDLPGTLNTQGVFRTLSMLDYLFVPILADRMVVESSIMYSKILQEQLVGKTNYDLKGIYHFWTAVDRRIRIDLYDRYYRSMSDKPSELKFIVMDNFGQQTELSVSFSTER